MIKRMMLAAIAAALAFAALPALAAAEYEVDLPTNHAFNVAGGPAELISTYEGDTVEVDCESSSGEGKFTNSQTGELKLKFHGCVETYSGFEFPCTTPGEPEGTISTTQLTFHLKTVEDNEETSHGILITGEPLTKHEDHLPAFATFECFVLHVTVGGNGIVGTVTAPETGNASNTMTLSFSKNASDPHHQTHQKVVGDSTVYNLRSSLNGGPTETASETADGTATFLEGGKGTLTEVE